MKWNELTSAHKYEFDTLVNLIFVKKDKDCTNAITSLNEEMLIILYAQDSDGKSLLEYAKSRNCSLTEKAILDISENEENKKLAYTVMSETRNSESTVYNTTNDEPLSQIISPPVWCSIAVGIVIGALAIYFLASLIFGIVIVNVVMGVMGAALGAVAGFLSHVVIDNCEYKSDSEILINYST